MYDISLRAPSDQALPSLPIWIDPRFMLAVQELHQLEALQLLCHKGEQLVAVLPLYRKKEPGLEAADLSHEFLLSGFVVFLGTGA